MVEDDAFLEDSQSRALCVKCGTDKFQPYDRCDQCGFVPKGLDLAKSTYLSVWRYDDPARQAGWSRDLRAMAATGAVDNFAYEPAELKRLGSMIDTMVASGPAIPRFAMWLVVAVIVGLALSLFKIFGT